MSRVAKLTIIVVAASLISIVIGIARSSQSAEQRKLALIQRIKQSPDIPINFTNFEGVPLSIRKAATKEISAVDYHQLTGEKASSADRFAAFPDVTVVNEANQRVTRLMVTVGNRQTKKWFIVTFREANIAPQQTFSMTARDWSRDKSSRAENDNKTGTALSKVRDFDEPRLWWPGGASANNLVFRIALVEFENGTKWQADEARGSLW
jgi:hypothetical protein